MATSDDELILNTKRLFSHLHRGGHFSHLWTDAGHRSYWFRVNGLAGTEDRRVPRAWRHHNVYFAVHPSRQIPPHSLSGRTEPSRIGSQLDYIAVVNALYAEFDGKDSVAFEEVKDFLPADYGRMPWAEQLRVLQGVRERLFYVAPYRFKTRVLEHIHRLEFPPSVIVDSGGGYHCYWLFRDPVPVDETNRGDLQALQYGWVQMVGGDPGASDLRRLLRMPGTYNMKPLFGPDPPQVAFVMADFACLYDYRELEEAVNDWIYAQRPEMPTTVAHRRPARLHEDLRAEFNRTHSIVDLLTDHGYRISFAKPAMVRLARPGREPHRSSVTVFPARDDGTPELSVHFSTRDPLYSEEYVDPRSGLLRRRAHDAYHVHAVLNAASAIHPSSAAVREE